MKLNDFLQNDLQSILLRCEVSALKPYANDKGEVQKIIVEYNPVEFDIEKSTKIQKQDFKFQMTLDLSLSAGVHEYEDRISIMLLPSMVLDLFIENRPIKHTIFLGLQRADKYGRCYPLDRWFPQISRIDVTKEI